MSSEFNAATEVARTNFRATVISAVLGCIGVVLAALIGTAVGRNRGEDTAKNTVEQQQAQLVERDKQIAQLRGENKRLREQLAAVSGGGAGGTQPAPADTTQTTAWREPQHNEEFAFALQSCSRKGDSITCAFTVVAEHRDRQVYVWGQSRLIDTEGKQWLATAISLAGSSHRVDQYTSVSEELVRGVPVAGTVTFGGYPSTQTSAPLLEIVASEGNVQFRSVPFM